MNKMSVKLYIIVAIPVVAFMSLLFYYRTDSSPLIAVSPYPVGEIVSVMSETKHIRFVAYLGETPTGETMFSYRWVNYTLLDNPLFGEQEEVSGKLDMVDVAR